MTESVQIESQQTMNINSDMPSNIISAINKDLQINATIDTLPNADTPANIETPPNADTPQNVDTTTNAETQKTEVSQTGGDSKNDIIKQIKSWGDEWSHIDEKIQEYKEHIKNLNNKKKELSDTIIYKMKTNGISCIDINDGFLQYIEKPTPSGFKKEKVKESVNKCINNMNKADEITEYIFNNKEIVTKNELKKIKKKKIKKIKKSSKKQ